METHAPRSWDDVLQWCGRCAVKTQETYNEAYGEWERALEAPALRQKEFSVTTEYRASVEREFGFAVQLSPLNLSYRITRSDFEAAQVRLTVVVEQIPIPTVDP